MSCLMINDIDAGLGRFGKLTSDLEWRNITVYITPFLFITFRVCVYCVVTGIWSTIS